MRQTNEELDLAAKQSRYYASQRLQHDLNFTDTHGDNLGKAANGASFIDPKVVAAIGLTGNVTDMTPIKQLAAQKQRAAGTIVSGRSKVVKGITPEQDTPQRNATLTALLRMDPSDYKFYQGKTPDWWETVDPDSKWRNLETPKAVNNASTLLRMNLNEAQMLKFYISNGYEKFVEIPGILNQKGTRPYLGVDEKGVPQYGDGDHNNELDFIKNAFPSVFKLFNDDAQYYKTGGQKPGVFSGIAEDFAAPFAMAKDFVQAPFKFASFLAPDFVGNTTIGQVPGTKMGFDLNDVGAVARGVTKGALTVFTGAAQATKSAAEQIIANQENANSLMIMPTSADYDDFKKGVVESNVLYQVGKRVFNPDQQVDFGKGYFPEGPAFQDARTLHDAALPKLSDGSTWTLGKSIIEPLVKEGILDRNGFGASIISGLVDGVFTLGTDPAVYFDPVQSLMKAFNLTDEAATTIIRGGAADKVRQGWQAEREAAGFTVNFDDVIDMPYWSVTREGEAPPKFAGMLPSSTVLPPEVQQYIDDVAKAELSKYENLAALNVPPSVSLDTIPDTPNYFRNQFGIKHNVDGSISIVDPTKIDAMPYTRDGRAALSKLGSFDNVGQLYDFFLGRIPIGAAVAVQDVVDAARLAGKETPIKEIHSVLKEAVLSGDPTYNMRGVPGILKRAVNDTGAAIAYYASGKSRQFATMPGSVYFAFDDPISSVNDMNRMMILMNVPKKERHIMLSKAIIASTRDGAAKRFELAGDWMKTTMGPALRKNGVPEEWIKQVTQYSKWSDEIHQYTMDAIGKGYPLPWLLEGTGETLREIDFMNQGFLMLSPDVLKEVIRETSKFWKLIKPLRGNESVENTIVRTAEWKAFLENVTARYMRPSAMGAPFPVQLVAKILPDEIGRVVVDQHFSLASLKALGAGGHVNYTTHGEIIYSAKEMGDIVAKREHLDALYKELDLASASANGLKVKKIDDEILKFEKKHGTKQDLEKIIAQYQLRMDTILPGANKTLGQNVEGLMAPERLDPRVLRYERQRNMQHAFKTTDPKKWSIGTARDIVRMSESPVYAEVAKALLAGGTAEAAKLPARFLSGDLRSVFDDYIQGLANQDPGFPLTSLDGANMWVATIVTDILTRTAEDAAAIGAVATKKLGGTAAIRRPTSYAPLEAHPKFVSWVEENLLNNPKSPDVAPFHATEVSKDVARKDSLWTKGFNIYRDASLKYARSPYEQYSKWKRILELMPAMKPSEAKAMAAAIDKTEAPEWLKDSLRSRVEDANGTITREQVEILGTMYGNKQVADLLYDSSKKSYFGSNHAIFFGFFDAWREQWSVWMRQILEQPTVLELGRQAKQGLENAVVPSWAGGEPGRGVIFKDEDTGKQAVALPFSKQVYSFLGLNSEERIQLGNLTLMGQGGPGVFGFGAMIVDSFVPKRGAYTHVRKLLFPFGDPKTKSKLADYVVAPWLQSFSSGALSSLPDGFAGDWLDNVQSFMFTDTSDAVRATTYNAVLTNIASNAKGVPVSTEEREKLGKEVEDKGNYLLMLKGISRVFLPAASTTKYFTEMGGQNYSTGTVYDDFRKIQADTEKAGGTFADGTRQFLDKWGPGAWIFLSGGNVSVDGMQSTTEYGKWYDTNWKLLDKYPLIAGHMGPQEGTFDPGVFALQRANGLKEARTPEERIAKAQNSLAWTLYNNAKDSLLNLGERAGLTDAQTTRQTYYVNQMRLKQDELKKLYPSWNPKATMGESDRTLDNQIVQIEKAVEDKSVLSQPAGAALKEYWDYRNKQIDIYTRADATLLNNVWRSSAKTPVMRQRLENKGEELVEKYPEFSSLWNRILSREFDAAGAVE
jgi:hypothetical protein